MIDFAEARRRVQIHVAARWNDELGTLTTLPTGYEDATHWRVIAGAHEALIDGDPDYVVMDMPALLVNKLTGAVEELAVVASFDRFDRMTPTGV